ncbi:malectin-B [Cylas formicarius]|uniref:malectin-B n=1 Tax=Cylas formicarius TaxID=197179 RepID=UPI002958CF8E|nr:malectin-B [Cylas formicarius]XP_060528486.1 malectin-B [Cylas formicarius]
MRIKYVLIVYISILYIIPIVHGVGQIIYAINAGGEAHVDSHGVKYERDPLHGHVGVASDYGKRLLIGRVPPHDHILYQTERYHTATFGYDLPINEDGDYVLVLKFCEVYFNAPDQKVFDIVLNGEHTVVADLDIFAKVNKGIAHDEYVPFKVSKGRLIVNREESDIIRGKIRVEFIKGYKDNPKINALYMIKGNVEDVPKLPPLNEEPLESFESKVEKEPEIAPKARIRTTAQKILDLYEEEESSIMLPVFIVIGAFIPVLFCLCKL